MERDVHLRIRHHVRTPRSHVGSDADDLVGRTGAEQADRLADHGRGLEIREQTLGERFVHHGDKRRVRAIALVERAPRQHRDAHRLEVAIHHDAEFGDGYALVRTGLIGPADWAVVAGGADRQQADRTRVRDARQRPHAIEESELESADRFVAVGDKRRHADAEGQDRRARDAEVLRLQAQQALHHQARGGHERQSQRHFGDDQQPARRSGAAGGGAATAARSNHAVQIGAQQVNRRRESGDQPGDDRDHQRKAEHAGVEGDRGEPREVGRRQRHEDAQQSPGEADADQAAKHAERDRLAHHLPEQPAPTGAERGADREIALAHDRSRQQQVRDVGAGDQEQQRGGREQHPQPARRILGDHLMERPRRKRVLVDRVVA